MQRETYIAADLAVTPKILGMVWSGLSPSKSHPPNVGYVKVLWEGAHPAAVAAPLPSRQERGKEYSPLLGGEGLLATLT